MRKCFYSLLLYNLILFIFTNCMVQDQSIGNSGNTGNNVQCKQTCIGGDVCFRGNCVPRSSVPVGASSQTQSGKGNNNGENSTLICELIDSNIEELMAQDGCFGSAPACGDKGVCAKCYKPCVGEAYQECKLSDIYKYEATEITCDDMLDNDCDGQTDFEDSDCSCSGLSPNIQNSLKGVTRRYLTDETEGWKVVLPEGFSEPALIDSAVADPQDPNIKKVYIYEHTVTKVYGVSGSLNFEGTAKESLNELKNIFTQIDPQTKLEVVSEGDSKNLFGFTEGYWQIISVNIPTGRDIVALRNGYASLLQSDQANIEVTSGADKQFIFAISAQKSANSIVVMGLFATSTDYQQASLDTKTILLQTIDSGNMATAGYFPVTKCTSQKISIDTQTVQRGVNIIWVEDSSPSIASQLQVMQAAADNFAVALENYNIDWQIIVYPAYVRQKVEDFYYQKGSGWIKRTDYFYKDINRFKQEIVILPGIFGCKEVAPDFKCVQTNSCIESPITTGRTIIQQMHQQSLLDANRQIVVVMSTDTRDDSLQANKEPLQNFIDFYKSENAIVFALHQMPANPNCGEEHGQTQAAMKEYSDLVAATNGEEANLCGTTQELEGFLEKIPEKLDQIVASVPVISLTESFIPATLTVFYEETRVPYSHANGIYLDIEKNSIMYGSKEYQPKDQQNISIQYQIWEKRELAGL